MPAHRPPTPSRRPLPPLPVLVMATLALVGCGSRQDLAPPVSRFASAASETGVALRPYIVELNRVERASAFALALADPAVAVVEDPARGVRFLAPTFDPEAIAIRLETLQLIELFALRLARAVGADAPARIGVETALLGTGLGSLADRARTLAGGDPTIAAYATPIARLTGAVGRMWAEAEEKAAIRIAVAEAAPVIDTYIALLDADIALAHQRRLGALLERYTDLAADYNARRAAMNGDERRVRLERLEELANRYETLAANPPAPLLQSMRTATALLVDAVAHLDDPATFHAFVAAVGTFSANAGEALAVARELRLLI